MRKAENPAFKNPDILLKTQEVEFIFLFCIATM
jgi:hypothetical protein